MDEQSDKEIAGKKQRDRMLELVSKGFYNELINYGVRKDEIIRVASHLLDNLMAQGRKPAEGVEYYNGIFTLASVKDEWAERKQLVVQDVTLRPLQLPVIGKIIAWLKVPAVRESFVPAFPENESKLQSISPIRHGIISASTTTTSRWESSAARTSIRRRGN